jgi:hypothetical protein
MARLRYGSVPHLSIAMVRNWPRHRLRGCGWMP